MKCSNRSFFVLVTFSIFSFSSRTSLQWTQTRDRATSAPQRASDFFHDCTLLGISTSRLIRFFISCRDSSSGQSSLSIRPTTSLSRPMKGPTLPTPMCARSRSDWRPCRVERSRESTAPHQLLQLPRQCKNLRQQDKQTISTECDAHNTSTRKKQDLPARRVIIYRAQ